MTRDQRFDIIERMNERNGDKPKNKKIQITFDASALQVIEGLKEATGETTAGVIRDALGFYEWARLQRSKGVVVGTIRNGKAESEVILPFDLRTPCSSTKKGEK